MEIGFAWYGESQNPTFHSFKGESSNLVRAVTIVTHLQHTSDPRSDRPSKIS